MRKIAVVRCLTCSYTPLKKIGYDSTLTESIHASYQKDEKTLITDKRFYIENEKGKKNHGIFKDADNYWFNLTLCDDVCKP
jgi:hypothetical protein